MARQRIVSRNINLFNVTVLTVDIETNDTKEVCFTATKKMTDKALIKRANELFATDTTKVVYVKSVENTPAIYGMLEEDFVKCAKLMTADRKFVVEEVPVEE